MRAPDFFKIASGILRKPPIGCIFGALRKYFTGFGKGLQDGTNTAVRRAVFVHWQLEGIK